MSLTCKDSCIHYPVCKATVADENWTDEAPEELRHTFSPENCDTFYFKPKLGHWDHYSTTMMECSVCKKHVPKHRYSFCPECGSKMVLKVRATLNSKEDWEQLTILDIQTGESSQ